MAVRAGHPGAAAAGWRGDGVGDYARPTLRCVMSDDNSARALAAAESLGLRAHGDPARAGAVAGGGGRRPRRRAGRGREDAGGAGRPTTTTGSCWCPGDREIAWPKLRALLGREPAVDAERRRGPRVTGYVRGTITPLGSTHAWPVVADASLSGPVSLGGGAHGVALTVDAADARARRSARPVADVTEPPLTSGTGRAQLAAGDGTSPSRKQH